MSSNGQSSSDESEYKSEAESLKLPTPSPARSYSSERRQLARTSDQFKELLDRLEDMAPTRPTAPRTLAAGPSTALVESTPKNTPEDMGDALDKEDIPMTLTPAQLKALLRENIKEAVDVAKQQLVSSK